MKKGTKVGLVGSVVLVAGLFLGRAVYSPSFYLAQQFECLRDRFIQRVVREDIGELPEYLRSVEYVDSRGQREFKERYGLSPLTLMYTFAGKQDLEDIGKSKIRSTIYVLPGAFDQEDFIETEEDFRGVLLDHEKVHAEQYFGGFPSIKWDPQGRGISDYAFDTINELSALREEIKGFDNRQVSRRHAVTATTQYLVYYSRFWDPEMEKHIIPDGIEALKELFFDDWIRRSNVFVEAEDGYYIINPKDGKRLKLPESLSH